MSARLVIRTLTGMLLIFVGIDHYYEYSIDHYSALPTIGPLFLLNFISATAIGLILLAPSRRIFGRLHRSTEQLAAVSGFAIATTSLVGLLVSEHTKLFGFMEANYRPAIIVALALEIAAAGASAVLFFVNQPRGPR